MPQDIPPQVSKYFWGDDLSQLNWNDHQEYIVQTLLEKADKEAIGWLFNQTTPKKIQEMLPHLKMSPKSRNFWEIYLSPHA